MQPNEITPKPELREELESMMQKRTQKPVKGVPTIMPGEMLKPLHDYLYQYELTPKEQGALSLCEFQSLLFETALLPSSTFKEIRKSYSGLSKLDAIISRILTILRNDPKYWIKETNSSKSESAIASYQEYLERSKNATVLSKETSESDQKPLQETATPEPLKLPPRRLRVLPGTMADLHQYLKAQYVPVTPYIDYMIQGLVLLLAQKNSRRDIKDKMGNSSDSEYEEKSSRLRPRTEHYFRQVKEPEVSVETLWKHPELVAFDFFLGQTVFFKKVIMRREEIENMWEFRRSQRKIGSN